MERPVERKAEKEKKAPTKPAEDIIVKLTKTEYIVLIRRSHALKRKTSLYL